MSRRFETISNFEMEFLPLLWSSLLLCSTTIALVGSILLEVSLPTRFSV